MRSSFAFCAGYEGALPHYGPECLIILAVMRGAVDGKLRPPEMPVKLVQQLAVGPGYNLRRIAERPAAKGPQDEYIRPMGGGDLKDLLSPRLVDGQKLREHRKISWRRRGTGQSDAVKCVEVLWCALK